MSDSVQPPEGLPKPLVGTHGTPSMYNRGCRCVDCTECNRARCAKTRADLQVRNRAAPHGTTGGYSNWACRCHPCKKAWSEYLYDLRHVRRSGTRIARST